jgi:hypothetical protein
VNDWTYDEDGDVHVSADGRFWVREAAGGWDVLDWLRPFRDGSPKFVDRAPTLDAAKALADEESEWGPNGENLSPARPEW